MKLNDFLAEMYLDAVLSDLDIYSITTIEDLGKRFAEFRDMRPTIYTDFLGWIESLVRMGCLIPLA